MCFCVMFNVYCYFCFVDVCEVRVLGVVFEFLVCLEEGEGDYEGDGEREEGEG